MTKAEFKRLQDGTQSEAEIEKFCTDWLALDGWVALTTDPKQLRGLGVSEPGIADKQYRRRLDVQLNTVGRALSQLMWIEWKKVDKNGKPTKTSIKQDAWHDVERARGFLTLRAGIDFEATSTGFQRWYRASGLMRRKI